MDRNQDLAELQRKWTPPPELRGSGERDVRLSGRGVGMAVLAGILILAGAAAALGLNRIGTRQSDEQKLLREEGKDTQAIISSLWRSNNKEHQPMIAYQFELGGRIYRKSTGVPLRIWKTLVTGATLPVRYLPADPTRSHPLDWKEKPLPVWVALLVGAVLASVGLVLILVLRRQLELLREGRPAPGVVTRHSWAQHGQKNYHYEFQLFNGSRAKGRRGPARKPPAIGTTLCIIYDPENPRRNAPYPMEMVTLEKLGVRS